MKYILTVSGGVDSIVLLDMVSKGQLLDGDDFVVAHFDHGIRNDSAEDAAFVRELAKRYAMQFEMLREELGPSASEETARDRRYAFLRAIANKYEGAIVTAHHADDMVESIAINMIRGTGWRGLAVLNSPDIVRPLLGMRKSDLLDYATEHRLEWREDSTNGDDAYLRNRLRFKTRQLSDSTVESLKTYRERQVALSKDIDTEIGRFINGSHLSRYIFISVSQQVGRELLRGALIAQTGVGATRPQLERALLAIKTLQPGKRFEVNIRTTLRFTKTDFVIE